jgi:hypothetical protein
MLAVVAVQVMPGDASAWVRDHRNYTYDVALDNAPGCSVEASQAGYRTPSRPGSPSGYLQPLKADGAIGPGERSLLDRLPD